MSRRMLALLEIDADGTIHVTSGPALDSGALSGRAPSWATGPNRREVTIERAQVRTRVVTRGLQDGRDAIGPATAAGEGADLAAALVGLAALRWLVGEGERP